MNSNMIIKHYYINKNRLKSKCNHGVLKITNSAIISLQVKYIPIIQWTNYD